MFKTSLILASNLPSVVIFFRRNSGEDRRRTAEPLVQVLAKNTWQRKKKILCTNIFVLSRYAATMLTDLRRYGKGGREGGKAFL